MSTDSRRLTKGIIACAALACGNTDSMRMSDGPPMGKPDDPRIKVVNAYPKTCPPPVPQAGDTVSQLFAKIPVPHLTDTEGNTRGTAFVDLNKDGMVDVVLAQLGVRAFVNKGCFVFAPHQWALETQDPIGNEEGNAPTFADFNRDGFLDFYLTSSRATNRARFFLSQGTWDRFKDHAPEMSVANPGAYARGQVSVADADGDGYFDMVVGANQIGPSVELGRAFSRFFVYRRAAAGPYESGRFVDIGGTDLVPGFGGADPNRCRPGIDKNGMGAALRDFDDDGDLDLIQLAHNDMTDSGSGVGQWDDPCANGENPFGIYAWQNELAKKGGFRFLPIAPGPSSIAQHGRMKFDTSLNHYTPVFHAVGHEAPGIADVDNDGDLDVLTTGPTDPGWHVHSDQIMGSYWRNDGGFRFSEQTKQVGLEALNWPIRRWDAFWGQPINEARKPMGRDKPPCAAVNGAPLCGGGLWADLQLYPGMSLFADFDNDGWLDLLVTVRLDKMPGKVRNLLFMNRGDGTFENVPTQLGGVDDISLGAQVVDLNGDGLLDLFLMTRATGGGSPTDNLRNKIYMNTGRWRGTGTRANHWINVRLDGLRQEQLIGAKIFAYNEAGRLLGRQDYFVDVFRGSHDPTVHFGLGKDVSVRLRVVLPDQRELSFSGVPIDTTVSLTMVEKG